MVEGDSTNEERRGHQRCASRQFARGPPVVPRLTESFVTWAKTSFFFF